MLLKNYYWLFLLLLPYQILAQKGKKIEITHADQFIGENIKGRTVQRLIGNVGFKQGDVTMDCDSAFFYSDKNSLEAFGNVHLRQGDSMDLFGDYLKYDGSLKHAIVQKNVRLSDMQMTLTTDRLDYDASKKEGYYLTSGTITDGENTLTSNHGYYFSSTRNMFFRKNVVLINPSYTMECDTLQYNIVSKKAFFYGPTTITSKEDLIYCESGWFNTMNNTARFGKNAYLKSGRQWLYGDSLFYDKNRGFGRATGNIVIKDSLERLLIKGEYAEHFERSNTTFITRKVVATKGFEKDSVYITADTLRAEYDSSGKYRILKAYRKGLVFNSKFQGKADSIVYSFVDSTINLMQSPVFWFGNYQATGTFIKVYTKNDNLEHVEIPENPFISSEEDSLHFNQIKGREVYGYFSNNQLARINVDGNGETIYFLKDDKNAYIGVNKATSSRIVILMNDNKVSSITLHKEPEGKMLPLKDMQKEDAFLNDFVWLGNLKPESLESLINFANSNYQEPIKSLPKTDSKPNKKKKGKK
jgi:lipopolysaccharide assembly outer membrane protein LptD (OstA)